MSQKFTVQFTVTTECSERVNANDVRRWAEERFEGCDLGSVSVDTVAEVKIWPKNPPKSTAKRPNQCLREWGCERDRDGGDVLCRQCREEIRDYNHQAQNP